MVQTLQVFFLPALMTPEHLRGATTVVIDILRASTTIACALAAGATTVIPCLEVEDAQRLAADPAIGPHVLGGERKGLPIPDFDCGNSPAEYTSAKVSGKTVIFTTTNGTRAMMQCRQAGQVFVGSFVNFSAVCQNLASVSHVRLLCAGTGGEITREDVLFAGAVANRLATAEVQLNDQAQIAIDAWRDATPQFNDAALASVLLQTQGGRNLQRIGLAADVSDVAKIDRFDFVPRLDLAAWRIVRP